MGHLSAWKFIKNNKKQVAVIVVALTLSVMGMYVVGSILASTRESFRPLLVDSLKYQMYLEVSAETLDKAVPGEARLYRERNRELAARLEQLPEVKRAYYSEWSQFTVHALMGMLITEMPLLEPEDIPDYLAHMKSKLVEGRLPEKDFELVVDSAVMRNQGYRIGDKPGQGLWTIVGVSDGPYMSCVGTTAHGNNSGVGLIVLTEEGVDSAEDLFAKIGVHLTSLDRVSADARKGREMFQTEIIDEIDGALLAVLISAIALLTVSITVAYNSYMRNRINEYCLYASLGFSRMDVYRMILREIAILFGAGLLLGALLSGGIIALIDVLIMHPMGLIPVYIEPCLLCLILAAMAAVIGILQFPALLSVHRIRTIDMLED